MEWKPIRHAREALFEQLEQFMFDLVGGGIRRQLSPLMLSLERLLVGLAAAGDAIPPNGELGEMLGGKGRQSVDRALRGLVDAGRARLDLTTRRRRVWLLECERYTEWGRMKRGHAPYCRYPRGAPRPAPVVRLSRVVPLGPLDETPFDTCQWPLEGAGFRLCPSPAIRLPGKRYSPYCEIHLARSRLSAEAA